MTEDQELSPFTAFPEEVRALIWNKLPQDAALSLRTVCRLFKKDIDDHYDHHLQLDDLDQDAIRWMTSLRIKECDIWRLQDSQFFPLKFPKIVKTIHIGTNGIYIENLQHLFTQIESSVRQITIHSNVIKVDFSRRMQDNKFFMKELTTLDVNDSFNDDQCTWLNSDLTIDGIFLNFIVAADKLETFKINVTNAAESLIQQQLSSAWTISILNFIGRHSSISSIDIRLFDKCGLALPFDENNQAMENDKIKKVTGLKTIKLELKLSELMTKQFYKLLLQQKEIQNLELINDFNTSYLPNGIDRKIIEMNVNHLTQLRIEGFGYEGTNASGKRRPFDIGIFQNCLNLTMLTISRNLHEPERNLPLEHELFNFHLLNNGLVELDVCDFLVLTSEILKYSYKATEAKILNSFRFRSWTGNDTDFGIDLHCLEVLMKCPNFIDVLISNVRFPVNIDKEVIKQRVRSLTFPLRYRESGTDLYIVRSSPTDPWDDYSSAQDNDEY